MDRVYIVRHYNTAEYDTGYDRAFTDYAEAQVLRDYLNEHVSSADDESRRSVLHKPDWHIDEEVIYTTAAEAITEWKEEGFLE